MSPEPTGLIDLDALRHHVADYDSLLQKLLELFLEQAPRWADEVNEAFATGDPVLVRQVCHKIKGGAGTLQATGIIEAAADLGRRAASGELARAAESRDRLLSVIRQTIALVRASKYIGMDTQVD